MELNEHLLELVLEAQKHLPGSTERQAALTKLMEAIWRSGQLSRPYRGQFGNNYEDIYSEACVNLFRHICNKIDNYNPEYPVMAWINFKLRRQFVEAIPRVIGRPTDITDTNNNSMTAISLAELDSFVPSPEKSQLAELREHIELDPQDIYKNKVMKTYPHVNFQILALRKLDGYSWKEIRLEFGISRESTISSFYERFLSNFELQQ